MTRPIGYYVHHHGDGHRQRALSIAACDPDRIVLLSTGLSGRTGRITCVDLPDDRMPETSDFDGSDGELSRPCALHYAPLNHDGVRARMGRITQWITDERPALIVVDVSIEVAMLARLLATPVVYVRLNGQRDDVPHTEAFRSAQHLLAPFHYQLESQTTPDWVKAKTVYFPGIISAPPLSIITEPWTVLVVAGRGGPPFNGDQWSNAARSTPDWRWRLIGPATPPLQSASNLSLDGWVDDAGSAIASAEVVIGGAGDGLVTSVIAAGKPFICLPELRPFDEQMQKAVALQAAGVAVVVTGGIEDLSWQQLLAQAQNLDPAAGSTLGDAHGAARAAAWLAQVAGCQK